MAAQKTALRTDLAVEAREIYAGTGELSRLSGVRARDERVRGFAVTRVEILDEAGEAALGKPRGTYLTLALDGYVRRRSGTFEDAVQADQIMETAAKMETTSVIMLETFTAFFCASMLLSSRETVISRKICGRNSDRVEIAAERESALNTAGK